MEVLYYPINAVEPDRNFKKVAQVYFFGQTHEIGMWLSKQSPWHSYRMTLSILSPANNWVIVRQLQLRVREKNTLSSLVHPEQHQRILRELISWSMACPPDPRQPHPYLAHVITEEMTQADWLMIHESEVEAYKQVIVKSPGLWSWTKEPTQHQNVWDQYYTDKLRGMLDDDPDFRD